MVTRYVLSESFAGPRTTAPVHTSNCEPCHGQVAIEPSSVPSFIGPWRCVHWACVAQNPPLTLNTATSPTSTTDPAGTSPTRNSFSLNGPRSFSIWHLHRARALAVRHVRVGYDQPAPCDVTAFSSAARCHRSRPCTVFVATIAQETTT